MYNGDQLQDATNSTLTNAIAPYVSCFVYAKKASAYHSKQTIGSTGSIYVAFIANNTIPSGNAFVRMATAGITFDLKVASNMESFYNLRLWDYDHGWDNAVFNHHQ